MQVEAALSADPDNSELVKLKEDLTQVIDLTKEFLDQQSAGSSSQAQAASSSQDDEEEQGGAASASYSQAAASTSSAASSSGVKRKFVDDVTPVKHWQVGEHCQALCSRDGLYYEATINEISTDGEVAFTFRHNGSSGLSSLGLLKISKHGFTGSSTSASKREQSEKQKEYLKKKKAKKAERFKAMDKAREDEKCKWKNFSTKAFGKKGFVKKSIFKTPENPQGRVGVGTCGMSGNNMTKFSSATKNSKRGS